MSNTKELARGKWFAILAHFGIDTKYLRDKHGPCPCCGGVDRFRWDNKDGSGSHYCSGCGAGRSGFDLIEKYTGKPFKEVAKEIDQFLGANPIEKVIPIDDNTKTIARIKRIGSELQRLTIGDAVYKYLHSRGIDDVPTEFLRIHPSLSYWHLTQKLGDFPAMVAAFTRPDGVRESLHLTYLTNDGRKADVPKPKKAAGKIQGLSGTAIRLSPVTEHIALTEGIETALSVKKLYGFNCWATYSDTGMAEFIPPEGVKAVSIYLDVDESFAGQAAAYTLAKRLKNKGYSVLVADHLPMGKDYNDLLLEVKHGRTA
jgi:putative DNA primase/helicase